MMISCSPFWDRDRLLYLNPFLFCSCWWSFGFSLLLNAACTAADTQKLSSTLNSAYAFIWSTAADNKWLPVEVQRTRGGSKWRCLVVGFLNGLLAMIVTYEQRFIILSEFVTSSLLKDPKSWTRRGNEQQQKRYYFVSLVFTCTFVGGFCNWKEINWNERTGLTLQSICDTSHYVAEDKCHK